MVRKMRQGNTTQQKEHNTTQLIQSSHLKKMTDSGGIHVHCVCVLTVTVFTLGVTLGPGTAATPRPLSEKGIATVTEEAAAANVPV